jgi:hypothetical protein
MAEKGAISFFGILAPSNANKTFLYVLHPGPTYTSSYAIRLMASRFRSAAYLQKAKIAKHMGVLVPTQMRNLTQTPFHMPRYTTNASANSLLLLKALCSARGFVA